MIANASSIIKIIGYQILITLVVSVSYTLTLDEVNGKFAFLGGLVDCK